MARRRTLWTEREEAKLRRLAASGFTMREVAAELEGRTYAAVARKAVAMGVRFSQVSKRQPTPMGELELMAGEIARARGCTMVGLIETWAGFKTNLIVPEAECAKHREQALDWARINGITGASPETQRRGYAPNSDYFKGERIAV